MKYFISHDKSLKHHVAIPLLQELSQIGIKCWFDKTHIMTGTPIYEEIESAIKDDYICIALINSEFLLKNWPRQELHLFHDKEVNLNTCLQIIPIYCGIEKEQVYEVFGWLEGRAFEKIQGSYHISDFEKNEILSRIVNVYFYKSCPIIDLTELRYLNTLNHKQNAWADLYNILVKSEYYLSNSFSANIIELWNMQKALSAFAEELQEDITDIRVAMNFLSKQKQLSFINPEQITYNVYTACSRAVLSSYNYLKGIFNSCEDIRN